MKWKVAKVAKKVITPTRPEELWTPANIVTLLRICGIPVFVIALISPWPSWIPGLEGLAVWKEWVAAAIFIILAATDALDGYLARSRGEVTNFGKFMDPLADKILVAAALLALIELGVLPSWVALVILTREFIVSGIRMVAASQGVVIAASWYGKAKTVSQIIALVLFIIKDNNALLSFSDVLNDRLYLISWAVMTIALVLTILSMLDYFSKAKHLLGFTSSKSEKQKVELEKNGGEKIQDTSIAGVENEPGYLEQMMADHTRITFDSLINAGRTVATAESCTGGMVSMALTSIPGSSAVVKGGVVSYSNEVKMKELGVAPATLDSFGAVSEQTALEMVRGVRKALDVDVAVATTGIAGPEGGTPEKPVGTVWIAVYDGVSEHAQCFTFSGDRDAVRLQASIQALKMIDLIVHEQI